MAEKNNYNDASEFPSLIKLLDDESDFVYKNIRNKFLEYGNTAADYLKDYLNSDNPLVSKRAKEIISIIYFDKIDTKLKQLSLKNTNDILEDALFNIASFEYPEIDINEYRSVLDKMALEIDFEISKGRVASDAYNILNSFNNYLFKKLEYKGNLDNYYDPDNSYINKVIDRKLGIPISLCSVYILLARRLRIPIYGINLPQHFIVKYVDDKNELFIDPFNGGLVVSKQEAIKFLNQIGMEMPNLEKLPFLNIAYDKDIIKRTLNNLIQIYEENNEPLKADSLRKLNANFD